MLQSTSSICGGEALMLSDLAFEIACLDRAGELDGTLNNLGLARGAVPFLLKKYPGAIRRYSAVRTRLGIAAPAESAAFGLTALSGPQLRCVLCSSARRCEKWLRDDGNGSPGFCPNRTAFERQRAAESAVACRH
jgi:hypothetical protein